MSSSQKSTSKFRVLRTQGALNLANLIENMAKNHIGKHERRSSAVGDDLDILKAEIFRLLTLYP